jgi:hypothetical protein
MSVERSPVFYEMRFGITKRHFGIFQDVAAFGRWILMVRGGKPAAIHWINQGLPAKPIFLKAKTHRQLGLLILPDSERGARGDAKKLTGLEAAQHHLCYVVQRAPGPGDGTLVAHNPQHPTRETLTVDLGRWPWNDPLLRQHRGELAGLVLDESGLPFTSDYDLGAVIPVGGSLDDVGRRVVREHTWKDFDNTTSPLVEYVTAELNRRMLEPRGNVRTSRRVMHGPQAFYGTKESPASDRNELVLIFHPTRKVECFVAPWVEDAAAVLREVSREYAPAAG